MLDFRRDVVDDVARLETERGVRHLPVGELPHRLSLARQLSAAFREEIRVWRMARKDG
jgi:hypothetical protein